MAGQSCVYLTNILHGQVCLSDKYITWTDMAGQSCVYLINILHGQIWLDKVVFI